MELKNALPCILQNATTNVETYIKSFNCLILKTLNNYCQSSCLFYKVAPVCYKTAILWLIQVNRLIHKNEKKPHYIQGEKALKKVKLVFLLSEPQIKTARCSSCHLGQDDCIYTILSV